MENKKTFVENELKNALMKADSSIKNVTYAVGEFGTEWVRISKDLKNYVDYISVNITGDDEICIMHDVSRKLLYQ